MASLTSHDVMSAEKRSALMSRIRGRDTHPEKALRRAVWALGLRYRLQYRIGRARPDLVLVKARIAVFVDGCFWHHCPLHGVMPKGNHAFWKAKLMGNVQRDIETTQALVSAGWAVLRLWEHEVDESAKTCASRIRKLVVRRISRCGGKHQ
ncbi:MAG: very short patch repair endonuclease [Thiobacillaceae bacterium]